MFVKEELISSISDKISVTNLAKKCQINNDHQSEIEKENPSIVAHDPTIDQITKRVLWWHEKSAKHEKSRTNQQGHLWQQ